MNRGGLTQKLTEAADVLVGGFRGGLAYVNLLTNAMAAAILGSAIAQISVMSKVMIPQMEERGYSRGFSAALTASAGLLGPIIPPSMLMIIYGVISSQSISTLFVAGVLPGLVITASLAAVIFGAGVFANLPKGEWKTWRVARTQLLSGLAPGLIPVVVISGIISGVMTPTESAAAASLLAFVMGTFFYKNIKLRDLPEILQSVALTTALITSLIGAASTFGWILSYQEVPEALVEAITKMTNSPVVFLLLVNVVLVILGMFLETISVLIVLVPILLPVVEAMHINMIHFGVVVCVGTVLGLLTPPVGPGLYLAMVESKTNLKEVFGWVVPFFFAMVASMAAIAIFPSLSTWLPLALGLK
jgi:tripartite ATP-independent transporter DctM subunit